jgi:hypothetical protein
LLVLLGFAEVGSHVARSERNRTRLLRAVRVLGTLILLVFASVTALLYGAVAIVVPSLSPLAAAATTLVWFLLVAPFRRRARAMRDGAPPAPSDARTRHIATIAVALSLIRDQRIAAARARTPSVFQWPWQILLERRWRAVLAAGMSAIGWAATAIDDPSQTLVYCLWGGASVLLLAGVLALCAVYWRLFDDDGGPFRTSSSSALSVVAVLAVTTLCFVMPVWFAVFVGLAALAVVLRPAAWRDDEGGTDNLRVRAAIAAAIVAAAAASGSSLGPQRFDRIESPLLAGRLQLAYIGEKGDDLVVGACNRTHEGFSKDPVVLRVDRSLLDSFVLVRSGYAFFEGKDPSLLSIAASTIGVDVWRPPSRYALFADERDPTSVDDVCGTRRPTLFEIKRELARAAEKE